MVTMTSIFPYCRKCWVILERITGKLCFCFHVSVSLEGATECGSPFCSLLPLLSSCLFTLNSAIFIFVSEKVISMCLPAFVHLIKCHVPLWCTNLFPLFKHHERITVLHAALGYEKSHKVTTLCDFSYPSAACTLLPSRHCHYLNTEVLYTCTNVFASCVWTQARCLSCFEENMMFIFGNMKIAV